MTMIDYSATRSIGAKIRPALYLYFALPGMETAYHKLRHVFASHSPINPVKALGYRRAHHIEKTTNPP